jgi:High potential iron-sulfur protein
MIPSFTSAGTRGRRAALRRLTAFLLAGAAGGITVGHGKENENKETVCVNLSALSPAENKRRKLDNYTEKSSDPGETCSGCTFFTRGAEGAACGQCQIFNGPANPNGRCDDWTARPA